MSQEVLLAENNRLKQELAHMNQQVSLVQAQMQFYDKQYNLMQQSVHQLDQILHGYTDKLHFMELTLIHSRTLRIDSNKFQDMIQEVSQLKEQVQQLHGILEAKNNHGCENVLMEMMVNNVAESLPHETIHVHSNESPTKDNEKQMLLTPSQPANRFKKQISWDPKTNSSESGAPSPAKYEDDDIYTGSSYESSSNSSIDDDGIVTPSNSAISMKALQMFRKQQSSCNSSCSEEQTNRGCCTFEECTIVVHLIYLHVIALISITGVSLLIVGISLEIKPLMVSGTIMVIGSYGLVLNHCFYRGVNPAKPTPQKMRVKAGRHYLDLNASVNETIDVDLTKPDRGQDILHDTGCSQPQQILLTHGNISGADYL